MKKLFLFLAMASTTMFVSCGSDDNGGGGTVTPPPAGATAITLTASAETVQTGMPVTFTVKNNLTPAVDVTSSSTFTVTPATGATFSGSVFTATVAGTYSVKAKNGTLESAAVLITVTAPPVVPAAGKYTFGGTDYAIDNMYYIVDVNASNQVKVFEVDNDGVTVLCSKWIGVAFNGPRANVATATHYYEYTFYVPVQVDGAGAPTAVNYPGEADAFAVGIYAEENLTPFDLDNVDGGTATFTSFITAENAATTTENASSFTTGTAVTISHSFNGTLAGTDTNPTGIGAVNLDARPAARGVSKVVPTEMLNGSSLKLAKKVVKK